MPYIAAKDSTQLYWREWGEGAPILFLNSLGVGTQMWDYQFAAFADQGFRCIGLDRRSHGRSDQPARGYDHDTFADDVAGRCRRARSDRPHSDRPFHRRRRDRALSHTPWRPAGGARDPARDDDAALLKSDDNPHGAPRAGFEAVWAQWRRDYPKWVDENIAAFFIPETSSAMVRWGSRLLPISIPIAIALSRAMVEEDFRAEMRKIRVPTLIIHGDRDRSAPIELTARPSAALIPAHASSSMRARRTV